MHMFLIKKTYIVFKGHIKGTRSLITWSITKKQKLIKVIFLELVSSSKKKSFYTFRHPNQTSLVKQLTIRVEFFQLTGAWELFYLVVLRGPGNAFLQKVPRVR